MFLKIEGDEYRREWRERTLQLLFLLFILFYFFSFWRITEAVNISFWNVFSLLALGKTSSDSFYFLSSPWDLRLLWWSGYTNRAFGLANCTHHCWGVSGDWSRNRQEHWVKISSRKDNGNLNCILRAVHSAKSEIRMLFLFAFQDPGSGGGAMKCGE